MWGGKVISAINFLRVSELWKGNLPGRYITYVTVATLQWRHNGLDVVSNHHPHDCLRNRLFRRRSKETPKLCTIGLCARNSPHKGQKRGKCFHLMASSCSASVIHVHYVWFRRLNAYMTQLINIPGQRTRLFWPRSVASFQKHMVT